MSMRAAAPLATADILLIQLLHSCLPSTLKNHEQSPRPCKLAFTIYCYSSDLPNWLCPCQEQPHLSLSG